VVHSSGVVVSEVVMVVVVVLCPMCSAPQA